MELFNFEIEFTEDYGSGKNEFTTYYVAENDKDAEEALRFDNIYVVDVNSVTKRDPATESERREYMVDSRYRNSKQNAMLSAPETKKSNH